MTKTKKTKKTAKTGSVDDRAALAEWADAFAKDFLRRRRHIVVDDAPTTTGVLRPAFSFVAWDEYRDEMAFVRVVLYRSGDTADAVKSQLPTKVRMAKVRLEAKRWSERPDIRWKGKRRFDRVAVYADAMTESPTVDWTVGAKGEL